MCSSHNGRRIVLATNVAETSLTVPGIHIHYVIDTGLARISRYSVRRKVQRLVTEPVSQASARQRLGRCGRIAAGVCVRLYAQDDLEARAAFTDPEVKRTNLASVILQMAQLGLGAAESFPFLDPPDRRFINDGYKLLEMLGAVNTRRELTKIGRQLARLPLDPRLGRIILAARREHCVESLSVAEGSLIDALTATLKCMTGVETPRGAWSEASLPPHLRLRFEVFDGENRVDRGRDLTALRARWGQRATSDFQSPAYV